MINMRTLSGVVRCMLILKINMPLPGCAVGIANGIDGLDRCVR